MKTISRFLLTAGISLTMALTFSCSSDDNSGTGTGDGNGTTDGGNANNGGKEGWGTGGCNTEMMGMPYTCIIGRGITGARICSEFYNLEQFQYIVSMVELTTEPVSSCPVSTGDYCYVPIDDPGTDTCISMEGSCLMTYSVSSASQCAAQGGQVVNRAYCEANADAIYTCK